MEGILQLLEWHHLLMLVIGVLLGIIVGALPGLTPTMGVALCIPFTFSLPATDGLILLGGIFCGSVFGGSIPSILFNVPGAPASVATTFDGYPMAQQGKARKALELATISSATGGLVGMLLLLFFAPILTAFSLQFGPAQTLWIAIFGIAVIAAISEGSITKNFIGGGIGILLAMIGISTFTGTARFTFGSDALIGGLHIVAVLIGLFAFPQALRLIEDLTSRLRANHTMKTDSKSTIRQSFKDVFRRPKAVSIGSGVGAFIGMIPGAGGNIASILAYNEAKRFSKNKQSFGKGNKEGVIASESANNALVGGSLVPLLTLGIPGSPTAAIFLGGLLIHGIWPGSHLFVENASVAYVFLYSMIAAQLALLVLGLASIRFVSKLAHIPAYFMAPVILSFCIIGAFTTQNSLFDVYTVVIVGMAMYFLHKFNFSAAPIALGFILGPIAEEGLLQGLQIGSASGSMWAFFFGGWWNIILIGFVVLTIALSIKQQLKQRKQRRKTHKGSLHLKHFVSFHASLVLFPLVLTLAGFYYVLQLPFEQRLLPQITLLAMIMLLAIEYGKAVLTPSKFEAKLINVPSLLFISWICLISLSTNILGFYMQVILLMISVPLYVYIQKKDGCANLSKIVIVATLFTAAMYLVFTTFIRAPLPIYPFFIDYFL
ncbi:tripartite tricarboxylate transporter permease [Desertibacillus haloalkaliphilus]|uniref:tripartite tricarboxylate transporter permease n=1 Tax=Desertibacillus haloalkaliphilus TaxID=1328930 RepID=UPI001C25D2AC|nr:tripartite tricarboxylate transporter permease [Desertibacillus haloalkaliphilus]MBU8906937.1 tripartite tricarboxylate transporter permease [Desertibacillus haloalkaliphilus]